MGGGGRSALREEGFEVGQLCHRLKPWCILPITELWPMASCVEKLPRMSRARALIWTDRSMYRVSFAASARQRFSWSAAPLHVRSHDRAWWEHRVKVSGRPFHQ